MSIDRCDACNNWCICYDYRASTICKRCFDELLNEAIRDTDNKAEKINSAGRKLLAACELILSADYSDQVERNFNLGQIQEAVNYAKSTNAFNE